MTTQNFVYFKYWQRKSLLKSGVPNFPLLKWWPSEELSQAEKKIFNQIKNRDTLLDIGAGDLRIMHKFQRAGYSGQYHTQDIGEEFSYTYSDLYEISKHYAAILCLDVIEHLPVAEGLYMLHKLFNLLEAEGVMVIQTPNARCIRNPIASDMTHVHCYNINDLWAYLTCMGLQVEGYRVVFERERSSWPQNMLSLASKYIITRLLGLDYADNIVLIAKKLTLKQERYTS